jgi:uncharacterized protein YcfJ
MMNSNLLQIILLLTISLLSSTVVAGHESKEQENSYFAYGDVITAEPIIRHTSTRIPRTECRPTHTSYISHQAPARNNAMPTLIGGLLGGIIGHQFGGGSGKTALTIAGTFAGATIANNVNRRQRHYEEVKRCTVVHDVRNIENVEGYLVTYRYQGKQFTRTMDEHPGSRVRIRIQVEPANKAYASSYTSSYEVPSDHHY